MAGYVIMILVFTSYAGAIMVANHAFGGDNSTCGLVGMLIVLSGTSLVLSYVNIKRLRKISTARGCSAPGLSSQASLLSA